MKNAIYAQSGGVTAVINASAAGVIDGCRKNNNKIGTLYAGENGILGILNEELIDTQQLTANDIKSLRYTPGGIFGSCRYKLKDFATNKLEYTRLIEIFAKYDIGYFFYNGGNDSADTCLKVSQIANQLNYPIQAIHIPKTIDNDLVVTDNCPGFGSVAKYVATSILEASIDLSSMSSSSTKVFILEVMGRHAGWIAASCGVVSTNTHSAPHIILFPEILFAEDRFIAKVKETVQRFGYCVIVTSEGLKNQNGELLGASNTRDAFGHAQLGGVAHLLAEIIKKHLGFKYHYAVADYLQRSARHIASRVDVEQSYCVGYSGVEYALQGYNAIMTYIKRISQTPYLWEVDQVSLTEVANKEKFMPRDFIDQEGFHITQKCRDYIIPLISGEDYPPFENGVPKYFNWQYKKTTKQLPIFNAKQ
jgi:6-phosphofructokinase